MRGSRFRFADRARTFWRLGLSNVFRVGVYRLLLKTGYYRLVTPIGCKMEGPAFDWGDLDDRIRCPPMANAAAWECLAERVISGKLSVFSSEWVSIGFPPRWNQNVITGATLESPLRHWTQYHEFLLPGGDIKGYWEASRFDGLVVLTVGWLCTRRPEFRDAIEAWILDWSKNNPPNAGLQWRCGQEVSIRLMQIVLVAELLQRWGRVSAAPAIHRMIAQHCARIVVTMAYAIGQDNNHGTSEAVALFVAGAFLARQSTGNQASQGARWRNRGRKLIENRISRLVLPDGSFSQHSVNYHRMFLDTCSFMETIRRLYGESTFSDAALKKCAAATAWLAGFTDLSSGDAPNLGGNDGARLFVLHRLPFRDHRPSVQWASSLFNRKKIYQSGEYDEQIGWLELHAGEVQGGALDSSTIWSDGGYAKLQTGNVWAMLRLPNYRFRPSHADALHLEFWRDGHSVLGDAGSYSYNTAERWLTYFSGTESHNTVQFDGRDQMPRLSRFLFSNWLSASDTFFSPGNKMMHSAYVDSFGARHRREVWLNSNYCHVIDEIGGMRRCAVLRWRLSVDRGPWSLSGTSCSNGVVTIVVGATAVISRCEIVEGWEAPHYGRKIRIEVLEIEVKSKAQIRTEISWQS